MDVNDKIEILSNIIKELVQTMDPRSMSSQHRGEILRELDRVRKEPTG